MPHGVVAHGEGSRYRGAVAWFVLAACMGPYPLPIGPGGGSDAPACDGVRQADETVVDAPFDRDGDGFVDGADPGCAAAYPPALLDCDDADPAVNPSADEVRCDGVDDDCRADTPDSVDGDGDGASSCDDCDDDDPTRYPGRDDPCDQVDNDCDDVIDPGCPDFEGFFVVDPVVSYSCAFGAVDLVLDQLHLLWTPPQATLINLSSNKPPTMYGTLHENGSFDLQSSVVLGTVGSCDEYYELAGTFSDEDTFQATFTADFVGSFCGSCVDQAIEVSAHRY
jgi:hypothetical protein